MARVCLKEQLKVQECFGSTNCSDERGQRHVNENYYSRTKKSITCTYQYPPKDTCNSSYQRIFILIPLISLLPSLCWWETQNCRTSNLLTKIRASDRSPLNSTFAFLTKAKSIFLLIANCTFSVDMIERQNSDRWDEWYRQWVPDGSYLNAVCTGKTALFRRPIPKRPGSISAESSAMASRTEFSTNLTDGGRLGPAKVTPKIRTLLVTHSSCLLPVHSRLGEWLPY